MNSTSVTRRGFFGTCAALAATSLCGLKPERPLSELFAPVKNLGRPVPLATDFQASPLREPYFFSESEIDGMRLEFFDERLGRWVPI